MIDRLINWMDFIYILLFDKIKSDILYMSLDNNNFQIGNQFELDLYIYFF